MSLEGRLFGRERRPSPQLKERIERWRALPAAPLRVFLRNARLVAIDVEVSGLDARRDRLLGVGAVALHEGKIEMAGMFHQRLPGHAVVSGSESDGQARAELAGGLLDFVGRSVLVTYNAPFVRLMLQRFLRGAGAPALDQPWIDIAWLLPDLMGREFNERTPFEEWQRVLAVPSFERHNGLADAFAIAQIMLVALVRAEDAGFQSVEGLVSAESYKRKIRGE